MGVELSCWGFGAWCSGFGGGRDSGLGFRD